MMKPIHFRKTREYLEQVKEATQKAEMLEKRIDLCGDIGVDAGELKSELEYAMKDLAIRKVSVSDMIARIPKVEYQWLLAKRYVELLDWFQIASEGNSNHYQVVRKHGLALPEMQDVLVDAGMISPEEAEDISALLPEESTLDAGMMKDYLRYRKEKKRREV